jgi:ABC-type Fe3+/spermidine/putrescine transport system ATPase subunit
MVFQSYAIRPEELYGRPSNHFIARFLGEANFVHAKVTAVDGNMIAVIAPDLQGGPYLTLSRAGRSDIRPDQSVDLVVRPERLKVSWGRSPVFFASKSEVIFRSGNACKCDVDRDFQALMDGDAVVLSITPAT